MEMLLPLPQKFRMHRYPMGRQRRAAMYSTIVMVLALPYVTLFGFIKCTMYPTLKRGRLRMSRQRDLSIYKNERGGVNMSAFIREAQCHHPVAIFL